MNQTIKVDEDLSLRLAKNYVKQSTADFEQAMDHLEEKLNETSMQIAHLREVVGRPRQIARNLVAKVRSTADQMRERAQPYWDRARFEGEMLVDDVRAEPTPFLIGFAIPFAVVGLVFAIRAASKAK